MSTRLVRGPDQQGWLLISTLAALTFAQLLAHESLLALGVIAAFAVAGHLRRTNVHASSVAVLALAWSTWKLAFPDQQFWPWIMGVPLLAVVLARVVAPRHFGLFLHVGHLSLRAGLLAGFLAAISIGVLWLWLTVAAPSLTLQRGLLPNVGSLAKLALLVGFALANAVLEEFIYRGLIQAALDEVFGSPLFSIVGQALVFAVAHAIDGVPSGLTGALLALLYGLLLGLLRRHTGGLGLPLLVHIATDCFIGWVLFFGRG